jgi:hypothetical protein
MAPDKKFPLNKIGRQTFKQALLLLIMVLALPSYSDSFTAKRAGQGFTGLTLDFTSSLSNPALLTKFEKYDDIFFSLNVAIMTSDEYNVIDTAEDISDNLDTLADDINGIASQDFQSPDQVKTYYDNLDLQVDNIITGLKNIDEKVVKIRNGS